LGLDQPTRSGLMQTLHAAIALQPRHAATRRCNHGVSGTRRARNGISRCGRLQPSRLAFDFSLLKRGNVMQVVVSGAAGRTGSIIMQKLLANQEIYQPRGIVRNEEVCYTNRAESSASSSCSGKRLHLDVVVPEP